MKSKKKVLDKILVVKVGTSTLVQKRDDGSEILDPDSFGRIAAEALRLKKEGHHLIIVSSAAITAGMMKTGLLARPDKVAAMPELQRLASIGWRYILNSWSDAMPESTIGEILLTRNELKLVSERDEALRVTHTLLSHGDVAIINENDAISHEEIAFGDNDTLSAVLAAQIAGSGLFGNNVSLVMLSDIDGVYSDPNNPDSIIRTIDDLGSYQHLAGGAGSAHGTGGMLTKFQAAKIAGAAGVEMYIANGREPNAITNALNGSAGTHFTA